MAESSNQENLWGGLTTLVGHLNKLFTGTDPGGALTSPKDGACQPGWNSSTSMKVAATFPIAGSFTIPFPEVLDITVAKVGPTGNLTTVTSSTSAAGVTIPADQHDVTSATSPCTDFLIFFWRVNVSAMTRRILCVRSVQVCATCASTSPPPPPPP